jgi:alpha-L-fucosidase 2
MVTEMARRIAEKRASILYDRRMQNLGRRTLLKLLTLAPFLASCVPLSKRRAPDPTESSGHDLRLWYREPANKWVEALPVGSGRLGAMIFGGVHEERLQINEDTLSAGGPYDPDNPRALAALPEVRRLIFSGEYKAANDLAAREMMSQPIEQMPYQTVGEVLLTFPDLTDHSDYQRELDLNAAISTVSFMSNGARFTRVAFASAVDQILVVQLTCDQPRRINVDVSMRSPLPVTVTAADSSTLLMNGINGASSGIAGALRFQSRVQLIHDGSKVTGTNNIGVRDATTVTLVLAAATSYRNYRDVSGDPDALTKRYLDAARHKSYAQLREDHIAEHRRLFRSVSLDLGAATSAQLPTDERVRQSMQLADPQLATLYFQYGRYLLISCSRPGTQPANLQGLWNDLLDPPWGCKYTININTEMNYWPAESTNLGECTEPLLRMLEDLTVTGARTAKVHYGARGWVAHHNVDLWRATAPIEGPLWGLWPTGGAWLCMTLWDHYDYHRDRDYLARIYPILKGAALFFLDTLVAEPQHGWLVTCPSISPENVHPGGVALCAGPTMDQQIIRDLFSHCITASETLEVDADFREQVRSTRDRLAPSQVGSAGQLQEWLADWDMQAKEIHHRHVSHLYGVYPSGQIDVDATPELAKAARRSLEIRGDEATGWGIAWRINLWARLGEGDHAHDVLRLLLGPERTYPNLFDAHPPFQIDGNFGGVSGIAEMLLRSRADVIHVLPALPKAWPSGSVRGLRARGGYEVDIAWKDGALTEVKLQSRAGVAARLRYKDQLMEVKLASGRSKIVRVRDGKLG